MFTNAIAHTWRLPNVAARWLGLITANLVLRVSLLNSAGHKVEYFGIDGDAYKFRDKKGSGQKVQGASLLFS